jgi:hypothetical protein
MMTMTGLKLRVRSDASVAPAGPAAAARGYEPHTPSAGGSGLLVASELPEGPAAAISARGQQCISMCVCISVMLQLPGQLAGQ